VAVTGTLASNTTRSFMVHLLKIGLLPIRCSVGFAHTHPAYGYRRRCEVGGLGVLTGRMECAARVLVTTLVTSAIRLSGLCQFALIAGIADHWLSQLMVVSY